MMKYNKLRPTLFAGLLLVSSSALSSDRYFICGPDEDGCSKGSENYCFCIPYNDTEAMKPYCLDFNKLSCAPLSDAPKCESSFIFRNQGECLAVIFQSMPTPPCVVTTHADCLQKQTAICAADGELRSCH